MYRKSLPCYFMASAARQCRVSIDQLQNSLLDRVSSSSAFYIAGWSFPRTISLADLRQVLDDVPYDTNQALCLAAQMVHGSLAAFDAEYQCFVAHLLSTGHLVPCRTGCSACCEQAILSNPFEAALIGMYLTGEPTKLANFRTQFERWDSQTRTMRDSFPSWAEHLLCHGVDDGSFDHTEFSAPCPFLVNDLCQIYPVRPYGCRSYLALSDCCRSPKEPGQKPGRHGVGAGLYSKFHQNRELFLGLLWERFRIDSRKARGHFLPDLVKLFLEGKVEELLNQCVLPAAHRKPDQNTVETLWDKGTPPATVS
jgi:Fe-S-cluster containining protein